MQWRGVIKSDSKKHTMTIHEQSHKYEECQQRSQRFQIYIMSTSTIKETYKKEHARFIF